MEQKTLANNLLRQGPLPRKEARSFELHDLRMGCHKEENDGRNEALI